MTRVRKEYVRPMMISEQFTADEYIAACWVGNCNISGEVYLDSNKNHKYDSNRDRYSYQNKACGEDFVIRNNITDLAELKATIGNAFVVSSQWKPNNGGCTYPGYNGGFATTATEVYNWDDHVVTVDSIVAHKQPNHS